MTIADVPEASAERKRKQDSGDAETQEAERRAKERKDGTEERRVGQTDVQAKEKESAKLSENAPVPAKERKATQKDKPYEYICPHYERDRDNAEAEEATQGASNAKTEQTVPENDGQMCRLKKRKEPSRARRQWYTERQEKRGKRKASNMSALLAKRQSPAAYAQAK